MRFTFLLLLYLLPLKLMAAPIERYDCINGTVTNSKISSLDLCALNWARQILELRLLNRDRLISSSLATFEPIDIKQVSKILIKIRIGNQTIKIRASNSEGVLLSLNRPFRGGELGFPHQGIFYPYTNSRNGLWGLLESVCHGKSKYDVTKVKGLSPKAFREVSRFARSRFVFYKGNCNLAPLYEQESD